MEAEKSCSTEDMSAIEVASPHKSDQSQAPEQGLRASAHTTDSEDMEGEQNSRTNRSTEGWVVNEVANFFKAGGHSEALQSLEQGLITSAHTIDSDSWLQVGLMLVTGFTSGYILSMPNLIMKPLGWGWGFTCLLVFGFFSAYANWVLSEFHSIQGQRFIRYRDLMGFLFGRRLYYLTWALQFLTLVLINMGFILLGGRALKEVNSEISSSPLRLQYLIIVTGATYLVFANLVPTMSAMKWWLGVAALFSTAYILVPLVPLVKDGSSNTNRDYEIGGGTAAKVLNAFGAISAIISCHNSGFLPEIQSTLRKPQVKNTRKALSMQFSVGLMVYYGIILLGYWAYGSSVSDYLPKDLSGSSKWTKILINSGVFLQSIVSQHMFAIPIHEAMDTEFLKEDETIYSRENYKRRFILRMLFFMGCTLVAAALPFIGDFVTVMGSFNLTPLTFVFPSMIVLKVTGKTSSMKKKVWHWILIVVFVILALLTTIAAVRSIVNNVRNYHFFADT